MKTTNAVIDYINRKLNKEIPQPVSVKEYSEIQEQAAHLEEMYTKEMMKFSETLIDSMKKSFSELKGAEFRNTVGRLSITTAYVDIAKQASEDAKCRSEYIADIVARILAGLSAIKDMDSLDIFIANTIERMSK